MSLQSFKRHYCSRRGFALVLVAAMAGLVFLLGASLIVTAQLQTQANQYDQKLRLARENARTALEMAVSDLQRYAGKDQVATFQSDVYRTIHDENFNAPSDAAVSGLENAFWTGVRPTNGTNDEWLVTRPRVSDLNGNASGVVADPSKLISTNFVTLVGDRTAKAGSNQEAFNVKVPRETVVVAGAEGFAANVVAGHYAYWVGDAGVKASYAVYDKSDKVDHGIFADTFARERLWSSRMNEPLTSTFDVNMLVNETASEIFMSDFQLRGGDGSADYFSGLTSAEIRSQFHDLSPLSIGLLTNPYNGGLKRDLSPLLPTRDGVVYDEEFRGYLNVAEKLDGIDRTVSNDPSFLIDDRMTTIVDGVEMEIRQSIMLNLTEFNINASVFVVLDNSDPPKATELWISFNAAFELWNPYTASLTAEALQLRVLGLPKLGVWFDDPDVAPAWAGALFEEGNGPVFELPATVNGSTRWRGGQICAFSGGENLTIGSGSSVRVSKLIKVFDAPVPAPNTVHLKFVTSTASPFEIDEDVDVKVEVFKASIVLDDAIEDAPLAVFAIEERFRSEPGFPKTNPVVESPDFGFRWRLLDSVIWGDGERIVDGNPEIVPVAFHPSRRVYGQIELGSEFDPISNRAASPNLSSQFQDSSVDLIAMHDIAPPSTVNDWSRNDVPVIELPFQELSSISQLSGAYSPSTIYLASGNPAPKLAEPGSPNNKAFDDYYFSTIPSGNALLTNGWSVGDVLPNSNYHIDTGLSGYQPISLNSAEGVRIKGAFNVNSTSIEAWKAILASLAVSRSAYWNKVFIELEKKDDGNDILDNERYLVFNFPISSRETASRMGQAFFDFKFDSDEGDLAQKRHSFRQGVIALTRTQMDQLATAIVENIRKRAQGVPLDYDVNSNYGAGNKGPFVSLEDFLDSGVLQNAIDEADIARDVDGNLVLDAEGKPVYKPDEDRINPAWVVPGSPREVTQATIMNLIGPYVSTRSDTFLVRAYGDAVDPGDPAKVLARAYCEAVVQRTYEMHENAAAFGRKFEVVAFRWMDGDEI